MTNDPFLVVGAGRSGTSLLAAMLNHHPKLECGMELNSVNTLSGKTIRWWESDTAQNRVEHFFRSCKQQQKSSQLIWGNKVTTEQLAFLDPLCAGKSEELFFNAFANSRVIYVLRDARSCVPSKMTRMGKSLVDAIASWRRSLKTLTFLQQESRSRYLLVKMEDLVSKPTEVLKTVCAFLAIDFDEQMLLGADSSHLPEIYQNQGGVRPEKANLPPREDWHADVFPELKSLGYY